MRRDFGMTAWDIHEIAMKGMDIYQPYADCPIVVRKTPTIEQAKAFVKCAQQKRNYLHPGCYCGRHYTYEEGKEIFRRYERFVEMALDMRDVVFVEDGKQGLRRVTGELIVPAVFDKIPERYDYVSQIGVDMQLIKSVPVISDNKYALCRIDGQGTLVTDFVYDKIFRYFYGSSNLFVVERNGKKGLLDDCTGEVVVPCEMDEFYEQMDTDGIIPYNQGKKWGMVHFGVSTGAIFDDIDIRSEMSAKAKVGDEWFFVDGYGKPTKDQHEAWFGSWYDADK